MTKQDIINYIGPTINAQLTLTWDTKQSLEGYIDILDGETPTIDDFLEYVLSNAVEYIKNTAIDGDEYIARELKILTDSGNELY